MAFGSSLRSSAIALALVSLLQPADAWVEPVVAKGNKFFSSQTGDEFRLKGMAYYPRPNAGDKADVSNYDWAADEHEAVWTPHLKVMKDLGVNTIRLYSIDPSKSHDKFMCACSDAGIYVLVGMTAPCKNCSIENVLPPLCYAGELLERAMAVYNSFAVYDNTLGFSIGNENNLMPLGTAIAPCVKAFLRDTRKYAASCSSSLRKVPIGLDIADIPPRAQWIQYYDCQVGSDENTRAEWMGFNPYVECDPVTHTEYAQSTGLKILMKEYSEAACARPILFGEFGCNAGLNTIDGFENQRSFYDADFTELLFVKAKWMNEAPEMTAEIVGGNVFEFTTEIANLRTSKTLTKAKDAGKFGVGYFQPDNCDHDAVPCVFTPYPEYDNLKLAYTTTKGSALKMSAYTATRTATLTCPTTMSTELPTTPRVNATMQCSSIQPVCNGKKSNSGEKSSSITTSGSSSSSTGTVISGNSSVVSSPAAGSSPSSSAAPVKSMGVRATLGLLLSVTTVAISAAVAL
ncbi:1,3-beta-glucanosyltransferase gel1 [Globisporangium polare]